MSTRYGPQPALQIMERERWTFARVARDTGMPYAHIAKALNGGHRPRPEFIAALSELLGYPPEELWTSEVLSQRFCSKPRDEK